MSIHMPQPRFPHHAWSRVVIALALTLGAGVPALAEVPPFRIPQPVVRTLPNGLTVAQVQLTVPAGAAAEGTLPAGVAYITSQMVGRASASRDPRTMQEDLERAGGRMTTRIGRDGAILSATFLASQVPAGIELVSDAVQNALLTDSDFGRARRGAYSLVAGSAGVARQADTPRVFCAVIAVIVVNA